MKPLAETSAKDPGYGPLDGQSFDASKLPSDLGLGAYLRKARETVRLSAGSVALSLHVDAWIIEALEQEDFEHLAAPVYVKGYLRNYARLIGAPEEQVLELYHRTVGPDSHPFPSQAEPHSEPQLRWGVYLAVLAVVSLPFIWAHDWSGSPKPPESEGIRNLEDKPGLERTNPDSAGTAKAPENPPPLTDSGSLPLPLTVIERPAPEAATPTPLEDAHSNSSAAAPAASARGDRDQDTLTVQTREAAWISVHDQKGHRLIFETLPAGASRTAEGVAPFAVILGNARATTVSFNGQAVDPSPYIVGTRARFKLEKNPSSTPPATTETATPAKAAEPGSPATEGTGQIGIQATTDTWVSIKDHSGKRLAFETLSAGASRTYYGVAPFSVVLGNAPGTHLEYNGEAIDLAPHTVGTRARLTLGKH
jgi:cytoskeleton protein RodZ